METSLDPEDTPPYRATLLGMKALLLAALIACLPEQSVINVVQWTTGRACTKYHSSPATYFCADPGSVNSGYTVTFRTGPHAVNTATADVAPCTNGQCGANWFAVQCQCGSCNFVTPR